MIRRIVVALAVLAVTLAGTPSVAHADPYSCWNTGCDGFAPNNVPACWNDKIQLLGTRTYFSTGAFVELVYSPTCGAVWAHTNVGYAQTIRVRSYTYSWTYRNSSQITTSGYEPWNNTRMVGTAGYIAEGGRLNWWGGPGLCDEDWACTPVAQF